jgi:predicted amidohydrolase
MTLHRGVQKSLAWLALVLAPAAAAGEPNLLTQAEWRVWSSQPNLATKNSQEQTPEGTILRMQSTRFECYGKWIATVPAVQANRAYEFDVLFRSEKVTHEDVSVAAILTWRAAEGKGVRQRDYADIVSEAGEGWKRLSRRLIAPEGTASLGVELALRWTADGTVIWRNPRLRAVDTPAKRPVRVVTTRMRVPARPTVASNMAAMSDILDRAGAEKPDIVVLTEAPVDRGVSGPLDKLSEPIPGPATNMIADKARRYRTYVVVSLHESEAGVFYNTAVLIDRNGRIAGKYRKVHLATVEGERGITPGTDFPVFQTDFGTIGMLVCWDNWFGESARALRLRGAEMILLPIAGDGVPGHWEVISRARAIDNGVYLVSSSTLANPSCIIDPNGEVLASTSDGIAVKDIDLSQQWRVHWLSVGPSDGEARSLYIKERRPDTYRLLADPQ